jgi:hypothetical protein
VTRSHHTAVTIAVVDQRAADLSDMVSELVDQTRRREVIGAHKRNHDGSSTWVTRDRWTTHPSLVDQLRSAVEASSSTEAGAGARPGFASSPAARLEAVDAYLRIERECAAALRAAGVKVPATVDMRGVFVDVSAAIRRLHATVGSDALADVRAWHTTARVVTGWDSPAWKPDNTCLACSVRGGLRVRLDRQAAVCVECGSTWDRETIGILADHIRQENAGRGVSDWSAVPLGRPCRCLLCDPGYPFWRLCPQCGFVAPSCQKPLDHRVGCTGPGV